VSTSVSFLFPRLLRERGGPNRTKIAHELLTAEEGTPRGKVSKMPLYNGARKAECKNREKCSQNIMAFRSVALTTRRVIGKRIYGDVA